MTQTQTPTPRSRPPSNRDIVDRLDRLTDGLDRRLGDHDLRLEHHDNRLMELERRINAISDAIGLRFNPVPLLVGVIAGVVTFFFVNANTTRTTWWVLGIAASVAAIVWAVLGTIAMLGFNRESGEDDEDEDQNQPDPTA